MGHLLSSLIASAVINNIGDNTIIPIILPSISNILFPTIARPSSCECLYSQAISEPIFSLWYTTFSKKNHSLIWKNLVVDNLIFSNISWILLLG